MNGENPGQIPGGQQAATVCVPTCLVEVASVSVIKGGDYLLLLRTDAGSGRFIVRAALGREIFRITNPVCKNAPAIKQSPAAVGHGVRGGRRTRLDPAKAALYARIVAEDAAGTKSLKQACAEIGIRPNTIHQWTYKQRAIALAAKAQKAAT